MIIGEKEGSLLAADDLQSAALRLALLVLAVDLDQRDLVCLSPNWEALLCADLELTPEVRDDHASYIAFWLEVLKNDRAIFAAAAHAQRAVDYLHKLQPELTSGSSRRGGASAGSSALPWPRSADSRCRWCSAGSDPGR